VVALDPRQPTPTTGSTTSSSTPFYVNCDAVRVADADPIHSAEPGYRAALDRDGDGVGCEQDEEAGLTATTTARATTTTSRSQPGVSTAPGGLAGTGWHGARLLLVGIVLAALGGATLLSSRWVGDQPGGSRPR
jgi:hypothetical protein